MAVHAPPLLPQLDRGWHRLPQEGACFMELASLLAGERWSDSPRCTHWALSQLARLVNDMSTDAGRPELAPLVPAVIGQVRLGEAFAEEIALLAALRALPLAAPEGQRNLALMMLQIIDLDRAGATEPWRTRARDALADLPQVARWARHCADRARSNPTGASAATSLTIAAVMVLAGAERADHHLRELLAAGIEWARERSNTAGAPVPELTIADWGALVSAAEPAIAAEPARREGYVYLEGVPCLRTAKESGIGPN